MQARIFEIGRGQFFANLRHVSHPHLLRLPLFAEAGQLAFDLFHFVLNFFTTLNGTFFGFFCQLTVGQLKLGQTTLYLVDLGRNAFQLDRQPARGFVD